VQHSPERFAATAKLKGVVLLPLQHWLAKCCCCCRTSQPAYDDMGIFTFTAALLLRVMQFKQKFARECCKRAHQSIASLAFIFLLPLTDFAVQGGIGNMLNKSSNEHQS